MSPLYAPKPDVDPAGLLYLYKAGRVASGDELWKDEIEEVPTAEQLGESVVCLVRLVWRLQQVIAIREQDERITEQERLGYR